MRESFLGTDGAEDFLGSNPANQGKGVEESLARWAGLTQEEMLLQLTAVAESSPDDDPRRDDVTVVALDIDG